MKPDMNPTSKPSTTQPQKQLAIAAMPPQAVTTHAQQLAAVICNALGILWAAGEQAAAKAPVQFRPDTSPFGAMAQTHGVTVYTLTSPNEVLAVQFPAFMFFLLPTTSAKDILDIVRKIRAEYLHQLINA